MRQAVAIAVAGVVAMLLQTTVFPLVVPMRLAPNLLLILVVYLGVHQFGARGALGAFLLGYFLDTFSGTVLGVQAFAFTAVYLGTHQVARVLWMEGGLPAAVITFAAVCADTLLVLALTALAAGADGLLWRYALRAGGLEAAVAAAVTPLVFRAFAWEQRLLRVG